MDNDDQTIGTILTRREALLVAGVAGFGLFLGFGGKTALASPQTKTVQMVATPQATEGPFFVDTKLNRSNLIGTTNRKAVIEGLPLILKIRVYELDGREGSPLEGAVVDIWHCDADGVYSDEPSNQIQAEDTQGQQWLRGYQVTDKNGEVSFQTIYPGWYIGRTIHIHFKVRVKDAKSGGTYEFTSQLYFEEGLNDQVLANAPYAARGDRRIKNSNDGIYRERQMDGTHAGKHLTMQVKDNPDGKGKIASFSAAFDMDAARSLGR